MQQGGPVALSVERFVEPYTGMPLVGVGGYGRVDLAAVEVRIDDGPALTISAREAASGSPAARHFAGHFPCPAAGRLTVIALGHDSRRVTWFDSDLDAVPVRVSAPAAPPNPWRRLKSRVRRALTFARELPGKIEYRLWKRRFRPAAWYESYVSAATPNADDLRRLKLVPFQQPPTISILCPVFNVDPKWLRLAVESVRRQPYDHWELCLADDASTNPATLAYLKSLTGDPRIKVTFRETNGHICRATNSAADLATGDFVALLDNDDELAVDALYHVAAAISGNRDVDLLYSDEDKIDAQGRRYDPQFKPAWSPELMLSYNYINHFTVVRRALFESVGRFRQGFEGSQDHDLLLRIAERTDRVVHIPRILYHWRSLPSSTASAAGVKQYVHDAGRKALDEACLRRGIVGERYQPAIALTLNLPILALTGPDHGPAVTAIVTGTPREIEATIAVIREKTSYAPVEFIPNPDDTAEGRNRAAAKAKTELLLVIDAGIEPLDSQWLSKLVANLRSEIGLAAPRIMNPDGSINSAGVVMGLRDGAGPVDAFAGVSPNPASYYFFAEVTRNVSAVSGRCFLTRRETFESHGGFDVGNCPETSWDVDYARRMRDQGLRALSVGDAVVRDRLKRARVDAPREWQPWGAPVRVRSDVHESQDSVAIEDPFHNPNCSRSVAFALGEDPCFAWHASPIPVLVFAHNLAAAEGAPRYLSELVVGLKRRGSLIPTVICGRGGAGESAYRDEGIPVELYGQPWGLRIIDGLWTRNEYLDAVEFFRSSLRTRRPEVVIVNTLLGFAMVEAAARERIPSVWIIHESYSREVRQRVFTPFANGRCEAAFAFASRVVPCSHDTAALFRPYDVRGRIRVRHNAIDPAEIDQFMATHRRTPSAVASFVAVGTICERKGQHTIVEAAANLARQRRDFHVEIVGAREGIPYLDFVRQLVMRRGISDLVSLVPETDSKPYFLKSDVYVNASHLETYSRSMLEAMAFGLPIISTPCQGVGEQVVWGGNALRFEAGDAVHLATQMDTLISNPWLRDSMAQSSRVHFERISSFRGMLNQFDNLIRHTRHERFD